MISFAGSTNSRELVEIVSRTRGISRVVSTLLDSKTWEYLPITWHYGRSTVNLTTEQEMAYLPGE